MREWKTADLEIDVDAVLRGQGADPAIIRERSPRLVAIAEEALQKALACIEPQVVIEEYQVSDFKHDSLILENGKKITGPLVVNHLAGARSVIAVLCTVGAGIDTLSAEVLAEDLVKGLAVDGVGSAAVEALANAVCRDIELTAQSQGMESTIPLSPGMIGWSVEEGQPVIFDLIDPDLHNVQLSPYYLMIPRKTLSMIIGIGPGISAGARICDFCAMRETCQYQDHFEDTRD